MALEVPHIHTEDGCDACTAIGLTIEAGAKELADRAGLTWDNLNDHQRQHFAVLADAVFTTMSAAALDTGLARPKASADA